MNLIFDKNGYQPFRRVHDGHANWLPIPERYTLELELGHVVMFEENWWDLVVNHDFKFFCDKINAPVVTCSPYYLHLCL